MSAFQRGRERHGNAGAPLQSAEECDLRASLKATLRLLADKNNSRMSVQDKLANILNEAERNFPPERLAAVLNFQGDKAPDFTMLHHFAYQGFPELITLALRLGADPRLKANSKKQYTPIFYALSKEVPAAVTEHTRWEIVSTLLATGRVEIDEICFGVTILQTAVYRGMSTIAQRLLDLGADPDMVMPEYRETPRGTAAAKGMALHYRTEVDNAAASTEKSDVTAGPEPTLLAVGLADRAVAVSAHEVSGVTFSTTEN